MRLLKNRSGAVAPVVALCLAVLVGFAAFAVDVGMLYDTRTEAQRAADAAALAAAGTLLENREEPLTTAQERATQRALEYAGLNRVRGESVGPSQTDVAFPTESRVAVTVSRRGIPPIFAGIFGIDSLDVSATAHAIYYQGGSATCLKPFAVPDSLPFTEASIHQEILVWKKSEESDYPLIKQLIVPNVRTSIESQTCNTTRVWVGDTLALQAATASMSGQVDQGLDYLRRLDTSIDWNPAAYGWIHDGFNRADWRYSSRVINIVTYDPYADVGVTRFVVTGFLRVFLNRYEVVQHGNDLLQYGIVLPHRPAAGPPCTPPNCSATSWGVRLAQ